MSQAATSTAPEDEFVCLFSEVFGLEKSQLLVPELGFVNVTGGERRVDYAIKTTEGDVAFEIDGPFHYDSNLITVAQYENDLLRQNSLITFGWRVFRWTDRQLREKPEQVKEQRPSRDQPRYRHGEDDHRQRRRQIARPTHALPGPYKGPGQANAGQIHPVLARIPSGAVAWPDTR